MSWGHMILITANACLAGICASISPAAVVPNSLIALAIMADALCDVIKGAR